MAQPPRTKHPLDILQGMLNGILIETGKALKASNKDGRRALAGTNTRLQSTVPSAVETFQQALDELECDIFRAKSVLSRDIEEFRSKRLALENPVAVVDDIPQNNGIMSEGIETHNQSDAHNNLPQSIQAETPSFKEEPKQKSPEKPQLRDKTQAPTPDESKEPLREAAETAKQVQIPSPPASFDEANANTKPTTLGINNETKSDAADPVTNEDQDASVDALFNIPDNDDTNIDLSFDNMDFSFNANTNTQSEDQGRTQNDSFDLLAFGTTSQDFNIAGPGASKGANPGGNGSLPANKQPDDLLNLGINAGTGDNMDLDLTLDMVGAEDSAFDDMFYGNEGGMSAGGEMEHDATYDNVFFGDN